MKKIIIKILKFYQKNKPSRLKNVCLYTPSCSQYMIFAIEKYGLIKGFLKGILRILKCRYPNGGIDYP